MSACNELYSKSGVETRRFFVEQAGVEPASENLAAGLSTIIAYLLLFPQAYPDKQGTLFR